MEILLDESNKIIQFNLSKNHKAYVNIYSNLFIVLSQYYGKTNHIWMNNSMYIIENEKGFVIAFKSKEHDFLNCINYSSEIIPVYNKMIESLINIKEAIIYSLKKFLADIIIINEFLKLEKFNMEFPNIADSEQNYLLDSY